jgi:hypothetical protein
LSPRRKAKSHDPANLIKFGRGYNILCMKKTLRIQVNMSLISKTIDLRVPPDLIYRALKDTRLEQLFPEFFIGMTRKISIDKINEELAFKTNTQDGQIEIIETFRLIKSENKNTNVLYTTQTNIDGDIAVESILMTHIANILYSLLMLETGYVNGLIQKE